MNSMKRLIFVIAILMTGSFSGFGQITDSVKRVQDNKVHPYFIISAGDKINAYFNDKPLELETISEFNDYVQANAKNLKDARVVVTGKPKTGTFDDIIKTLSRYRIKNVKKSITKD